MWNRIVSFIRAIRWYIRLNYKSGIVDEFSNNCKESFIDLHEADFKKYSDELKLDEIKLAFAYFNVHFRDGEVVTLLNSANDYEGIFRHRNSCGWLSHGEFLFEPYFHAEPKLKYISIYECLTLYFYVIAYYLGVDFYLTFVEYRTDSIQFMVDSMRNEPSGIEIIKDKYSVIEDGNKVNID